MGWAGGVSRARAVRGGCRWQVGRRPPVYPYPRGWGFLRSVRHTLRTVPWGADHKRVCVVLGQGGQDLRLWGSLVGPLGPDHPSYPGGHPWHHPKQDRFVPVLEEWVSGPSAQSGGRWQTRGWGCRGELVSLAVRALDAGGGARRAFRYTVAPLPPSAARVTYLYKHRNAVRVAALRQEARAAVVLWK